MGKKTLPTKICNINLWPEKSLLSRLSPLRFLVSLLSTNHFKCFLAFSFSSSSFWFLPLFLSESVSLLFLLSTSYGNKEKEKTLAMIKPDGLLGNYTERIKELIVDNGFGIFWEMTTQLDHDRATIFYAEHSSKTFFPRLINYMTSGPVLVMVLEKENAISDWRTLIGPTDAHKARITHPNSVRAMCGLDSEKNCVHGSDSLHAAQREILFFFEEISFGEAVATHDEL